MRARCISENCIQFHFCNSSEFKEAPCSCGDESSPFPCCSWLPHGFRSLHIYQSLCFSLPLWLWFKLCIHSTLWIKNAESVSEVFTPVFQILGCHSLILSVVSVRLLRHDRLFATPVDGSTPGLPVHPHLPEFTQTHVHRVGDASDHLILCSPLLLPSIFPNIRIFSNESVLWIRWAKYWSSSFSISPSNEYSGLISFRMDWCDLPAVQT